MAHQVETIIAWGGHYGVDALFRDVLDHTRELFRSTERASRGREFRSQRLAAGMTLRGLSATSGIPVANLSKYENGLISPTLDTVARIEHAMQMAVRRNA